MSKIPTAEEFLDNPKYVQDNHQYNTKLAMIEFAKLHVKAALKESSKKVTANSITPVMGGSPIFEKVKVNTDSILNAYPLTLIK